MPIDVFSKTTHVRSEKPTELQKYGEIPLFATIPQFPEDYLQGGCTIDSDTVPPGQDGIKWAKRGDIFRHQPANGLWGLISDADPAKNTDNGEQVVMLEHDLDCTFQGQSFNGVLRSLHVNKGALTRPIPAYLVGPNKQFQYKNRTFIDQR